MFKNKLNEHHDKTTVQLLSIADTIPFESPEKNEELKKLTLQLRNGFKLCDVRAAVFGSPQIKLWAGDRKNIPVFSKSFCDSSCGIIFDKFYDEFNFMFIDKSVWPAGGPHCYLQHKGVGRIVFDPTRCQYEIVGIEIPYERGIIINPHGNNWYRGREISLARKLNIELHHSVRG